MRALKGARPQVMKRNEAEGRRQTGDKTTVGPEILGKALYFYHSETDIGEREQRLRVAGQLHSCRRCRCRTVEVSTVPVAFGSVACPLVSVVSPTELPASARGGLTRCSSVSHSEFSDSLMSDGGEHLATPSRGSPFANSDVI